MSRRSIRWHASSRYVGSSMSTSGRWLLECSAQDLIFSRKLRPDIQPTEFSRVYLPKLVIGDLTYLDNVNDRIQHSDMKTTGVQAIVPRIRRQYAPGRRMPPRATRRHENSESVPPRPRHRRLYTRRQRARMDLTSMHKICRNHLSGP